MKRKELLWIATGAGAVLALIAVNATTFTVPQTGQALILEFGRPVEVVREPGLHAKLPLVQNVEIYDKRLLDFNDAYSPIEVIAADQKRLIVDAFVRYRITDPLKFKQTVGDERNIKSRLKVILEANLRQVIGGVPLTDVVSGKRAVLMRQIRDLVNAQAKGGPEGGFGIEVVDVRIQRADLPEANSEGIYHRMQTERERDAKQFRANGAQDAQEIRAKAEKERTILLAEARQKSDVLRGQGDAEATRIFAATASADPEFYQFYRTLQAYRKTLSKDDTTLVLSPDDAFLKLLEKGGSGEK